MANGSPQPKAPADEKDALSLAPKLLSEAEWPWEPTPPPANTSRAAGLGAGEHAEGTQEEGREPEALSFDRHLWNRFDLIWQSRIEPSQKLLEEVAEVLHSRAELERKYGESLKGFGPQMQLTPQENTMHRAVDTVLVNFRNRGEQSQQLADEIEHDIVGTFWAVAKQHREVARRIYSDMALLHKYCDNWRQALEKCGRKYGSRCTEAESLAQECLQSMGVKTADRIKVGMRAVSLSQQARMCEHQYYACIEQANRAQNLFDYQMQLMFRALQEMDEQRARCLKDGLMKLAVYETSWLRNLQYDLEATVKASESADPCADLQEFIKKHCSQTSSHQATAPFHVQHFFQLSKPKTALSPSKHLTEACASVRQVAKEDLQPLFQSLLMDGNPKDFSDDLQDQLEHRRLRLGEPHCRAAVCQALRWEVLHREPQGTELDSAQSKALLPAAFDAFVVFFKACLDVCDEQNDAWCGRDLMVLTQLFHAEGGHLEKSVRLLTRVYDHALWNKVTFWEEALLLGLCEAHSAEAVQRRALPAGSQFSKPPMTVFLERFVEYMMAFGISFDQCRNSVTVTLRKNSAMLGSMVKLYSELLLQRYEGGAAPSAAAVSAQAARTLGEGAALAASAASGCRAAGSAGTDAGGASAPCGPGASVAAEPLPGGAKDLDDFEAVALGMQASFSADDSSQARPPQQETAAEAAESSDAEDANVPAASDSREDGTEEERGPKDGEAFEVLEASRRTVSDVFG